MLFSSGTPVSSTNKTDRHDIIEILLKVALDTINQSTKPSIWNIKKKLDRDGSIYNIKLLKYQFIWISYILIFNVKHYRIWLDRADLPSKWNDASKIAKTYMI
jgi:hypothetical protein